MVGSLLPIETVKLGAGDCLQSQEKTLEEFAGISGSTLV
jgi:hypothetical protein